MLNVLSPRNCNTNMIKDKVIGYIDEYIYQTCGEDFSTQLVGDVVTVIESAIPPRATAKPLKVASISGKIEKPEEEFCAPTDNAERQRDAWNKLKEEQCAAGTSDARIKAARRRNQFAQEPHF